MCTIRLVTSTYTAAIDYLEATLEDMESDIMAVADRVESLASTVWQYIDDCNQCIISTISNWQAKFTGNVRGALSSITALFVLPSLVQISDDDLNQLQQRATDAITILNAERKVVASQHTLSNRDSVPLMGLSLIPTENSNAEQNTILYFPGNLEVWQGSIGFLKDLQEATSCNLYAYNYQGTGGSNGFPADQNVLINDGIDAVRHLIAKGVPANKITLTGRSLGGTLACCIAGKLADEGIDVDVVPLLAPKSIPAVIRETFSTFAGFFASFADRMDWGLHAELALAKLKGSIICLYSENDPITKFAANIVTALASTDLQFKKIVIIKMNESEFALEFPQYKEDPDCNPHVRPYTKREFTELTDAIKDLWKKVE